MTLALLAVPWTARAASCEKHLQAFNSYDELENGKLVEKNSIFDLTDWSRDSSFEGILATSETPAEAELVIEIRSLRSGKALKSQRAAFEAWKPNAAYRKALVTTETFFGDADSGTYTIRLLQNGKILCEQKFDITGGD